MSYHIATSPDGDWFQLMQTIHGQDRPCALRVPIGPDPAESRRAAQALADWLNWQDRHPDRLTLSHERPT